MIKQSTSFLDHINIDRSHYYIKKSTIVKKIFCDNRIFYPKFEKINEPLNNLVISQHLNKEYIIASPLLYNNLTNYLLLEYKGSKSIEFYYLSKQLLKSFNIEEYTFYQGKGDQVIQLFISVNSLSLKDANREVEFFSDALSTRLTKEWKCLPDLNLPIEYNIFTLPYKEFNHK